jgi:hypothetical protein
LFTALSEKNLAVFFRNNHFGTIIRYQNKLYELVTDYGYIDVPIVVWESLDVIDGYNIQYIYIIFKNKYISLHNDF